MDGFILSCRPQLQHLQTGPVLAPDSSADVGHREVVLRALRGADDERFANRQGKSRAAIR